MAKALHEELRALATRAQACDALVLDGQSPVDGSSATGTAEELDQALRLIELCRLTSSATRGPRPCRQQRRAASRRGLVARASGRRSSRRSSFATSTAHQRRRSAPCKTCVLLQMAGLRRGKALHHIHRWPRLRLRREVLRGDLLARARLRRSLRRASRRARPSDAMPRIERLVLALPPAIRAPRGLKVRAAAAFLLLLLTTRRRSRPTVPQRCRRFR